MNPTLEICIEIFGVVSALLYVYLEIKQRWSMWVVSIISSAVYVYVFFGAKFYADALLNVYYVLASIYGMWCWRGGAKGHATLAVTRASVRLGVVYLLTGVLLWAAIRTALVIWTDSPIATGDAFITAFSIVGMVMLARKILEQWHVWIAVNTVSFALYFYKGLYPTAVLYVIYTILSFYGLWRWKKNLRGVTAQRVA